MLIRNRPSAPETSPAPKEEPVQGPDENPAANQPTATEPAGQVVDIAERLQTPVPGVSMTNTPLQQAVTAIENYGSFLVSYDLDTMSAMNVSLDHTVSEQKLCRHGRRSLGCRFGFVRS